MQKTIKGIAISFFGLGNTTMYNGDFVLDENFIENLSDLCTFGRQRTVKSYVDMDFEVIK